VALAVGATEIAAFRPTEACVSCSEETVATVLREENGDPLTKLKIVNES